MNQLQLRIIAQDFKSAHEADNRTDLVIAARKLVALKAPLGPQWAQVAGAVYRWRELDLAIGALKMWADQVAPKEAADFQTAAYLSDAGVMDRAREYLRRVPASHPNPAAHAYLAASIEFTSGRLDAAENLYREVLRLEETNGRAWLGLAQVGRANSADLARMETIADERRIKPEDRAFIYQSIGMVKDKLKDVEGAFVALQQTRTVLSAAREYDVLDDRASMRTAMEWGHGNIEKLAQRPPLALRKPIFVTGLPRSGTTLVQQILSAHSAVDGGKEFGLAVQLEATVNGFAPNSVVKFLREGGSVAFLRDLYLRLVQEREPGGGAFVDKSLHLSRALGPMSVLFPESPIIWLRREPLDQAWSIYRTWLGVSIAAWTLEDIAHHMQLEDQLLEHWTRELPTRVLEVPYRQLVEKPAEWIERITTHCGLEVEAQQFEFHRQSGSVTTASALQVREPINRRGIGSAEPYREFLKPFIDAYEGRKG